MTERRLRRALIGVSMFAAVCVLGVAAVLWYWHAYLLGPSGDPFTRGPYLVRVDGQSAKLKWRVQDGATVELVADRAGRHGHGGEGRPVRGPQAGHPVLLDGVGRRHRSRRRLVSHGSR